MEIDRQIPRTNRSALLFGPSDIRIQEVPVMPIQAGEVLVKIEAATTCGTDIKTFKRGGHPQIMKTMPSPFGHEMAGTIIQVAAGVHGFKLGDRVVVANSAPCQECFYCKRDKFNLCENIQFINGAYAQYITVPSQFVKFNLHKIPENLSFAKASLSEPLACVLYACEKVAVKTGETVAIVGTGPMAFLFLQVLRARGARTVIVGRNTEKLALARAAGADHVIHSEQNDVEAAIKKITGGYGADVAIEAVGQPSTWEQALSLVCRGGRVCFYGGCARGTNVSFDTCRVHYDELQLFGVFHYTPAIMKQAIQLLADGKINTDLFISEMRTLEDLQGIYSGQDKTPALKYLIKP